MRNHNGDAPLIFVMHSTANTNKKTLKIFQGLVVGTGFDKKILQYIYQFIDLKKAFA